MLIRFFCLLSLSSLIFSGVSHPALLPSVHVEIAGLRSDRGRVWCFLYNSEKGFPKDQGAAVARTTGAIKGRTSTCDFSDLPNGAYAVSVYHDENENGRLDSNFLGIPKEGVGASNDAPAHMGPPKFKDAMFRIDGSSQSLVIHLKYF